MSLVLTIVGLDRLENGEPARLKLDRHGALIGRSPQADWSLHDPRNYISSRHCEIAYRDGGYVLTDTSTNGVFLNRSQTRMAGPHRLADGDVLQIGHYEIVVSLADEARPAPEPSSQWSGWESAPPPLAAPAAPPNQRSESWGPSPQPAISGRGPLSEHWAPPSVAPPAPSPWDQPQPPAPAPSEWSSPVADEAPRSAADIWGELTEGLAVDWARGGFGEPAASLPAPVKPDPFAAPPAPATPAPSPGDASGPAALPAATDWTGFLAGAGLAAAEVTTPAADALHGAGGLMKSMVAGLVVMLEARARAKAQLGAQGTSMSFNGNNPLKFARSPEKALAQLLNPPERGFMPADQAVEDAFRDLQAHQMATLMAMQGALAATLARFSPTAIRERAEHRGVLEKILPAARAAALWQAYEREFEGVKRGSDEAFMDVFAREFRAAYEHAAAEIRKE